VYCKNRERLLKGDVAEAFFKEVLKLAEEHQLLSDEHFTVDGTLIEAWASLKRRSVAMLELRSSALGRHDSRGPQ